MRKESSRPINCPNCGHEAFQSRTQFGRRDSCQPCGLHSWEGKPLVSAEIHEARKNCHELFDTIWKDAHQSYEITEPVGTEARRIAEKRIRNTARNRAYRYIAYVTGLPEKECHMADQTDMLSCAWSSWRRAA